MLKLSRLILILINDLFFCLLSIILAFVLRSENIPKFEAWSEPGLISIILYLFIFFLFRFDQYYFKYFDKTTIKKYFLAFSIYTFLFILFLFFYKFVYTPRSISIIQPILFYSFIIASRYFASEILKKKQININQDYLIIIGSHEIFSNVLNNQEGYYSNYILISESHHQTKRKLNGIKIHSLNFFYKYICSEINLHGLMIVDKNFLSKINYQNWKVLLNKNLRFQSISMSQNSFIYGPIPYEMALFSKRIHNFNLSFYLNKTIIVTGAGGSIGSIISKELAQVQSIKLILIDFSELNLFNLKKSFKKFNSIQFVILNILDKKKLEDIFKKNRIDIIIHAAAYKHVGILEHEPFQAIQNNYLTTKILYELSEKYFVSQFLFISTDKAVRPTSVMGVSKRLAELYLMNQLSSKINTVIVRFGNVINSSGSVLPIFVEQIQKKIDVTVTDKYVTRFFMSINQAVKLVLEANSYQIPGIYHLDMGEPREIWELANSLIRLHGYYPSSKKIKPSENHLRIKLIGLQEGEKLFEELLIDDELVQTKNKDIFMSNEKFDDKEILKLIETIDAYLEVPSQDNFKKIINNNLIHYKVN